MLDPRRLLVEHQGAPRLLGRAVRRRRPDGRPGRAHPGPPRRDARGGRRRDASATRSPGDVFVLNDPYRGGTHLPDITLVSPLALDGEIVGFAVTRAHHSDVGGMQPGLDAGGLARRSTRRASSSRRVRLVRDGECVDDVLELLLANVRTPDIRRGDLRAQIAANRVGASSGSASWSSAAAATSCEPPFDEVLAYARAAHARGARASCPTATYEAERRDRGRRRRPTTTSRSRVAVTIDGDALRDRLRGHRRPGRRQRQLPARGDPLGLLLRAARAAARRRPGQRRHLRAARASTRREGSLVNARRPAAVVAGNVETSPADRRHRAARARPGGRPARRRARGR